jgi:hypothetical protein
MPNMTLGLAEYAAKGCLVKPIFLRWIQDQSIPLNFPLWIERSGNREPDQWFHPSGHPMMSESDLLDYLLYPRYVQRDPLAYGGAMGTLNGTMWHGVVGAILDAAKLTVPLPESDCEACGLPRPKRGQFVREGQCGEHSGIDYRTRSKGHLDKILNLRDGPRGFDLKTRFKGGLRKSPDMDTEYFAATWPYYYYQAQEYMRITGLRRYIVLFLEAGSPWDTREYHIDFDPAVGLEIESKYLSVLARARAAGMELAA